MDKTLVSATNPYIGPRTFTHAERHLFFGREREARELLSLVVSQRLVLFYAQSGAGKSSLISTRLIPMLQERGFGVLPVGRIGGVLPTTLSAVDNVYLFNLMLSLDESVGDPQRMARLTLPDFLARLSSEDGEHFYYEEHASLIALTTPDGDKTAYHEPNYVLIIDQFEEIITTYPERWQEREAFFRQLDAAMSADPKMWVVLTLREDFVAALDPYAHLTQGNMRARYYMQRMGLATALDAVQKPAALAGWPFADGVAEKLVHDLSLVRIPGQVQSQPGQYVEPVQLQVVCYQLWEILKKRPPGPITFSDLQEAGDIDNALAAFYEQAIATALHQSAGKISERALRQWFETELITEANTRSALYQGLTETSGMPNALVQSLAGQFLLRTELRAGGFWLELVHDRFVDPIRQANQRWWARYKNPLAADTQSWLHNGRDPTRLLTEAALAAAQHWVIENPNDVTAEEQEFLAESLRQEQIRQEKLAQAARSRRQVVLAIAVVMAVLAMLSGWALYNARQASEQRDHALATGRRAFEEELAANALNQSRTNPDPSLALLLARQAVFTLLDIGEQPTVNAQFVLQQVVDRAPPWRMTLPQARHEGGILWVTYSPTGKLVATAGVDQTIRLWDVASGEQVRLLMGHTDQVWSVQFSPDGHRLVSASWDGTARIWELATGVELQRLPHGQAVWWAAFSPDGKSVVTTAEDRVTRIWDLATSREKATLHGHNGRVFMAQFSPGGEQLVTASADGTAKLWEVRTGRWLKTLGGHTNWVLSAQFNHAGAQMVTASADGTARLWDLSTGNTRLLRSEGGWYKFATFSHDDQMVVATNAGGQADLWDVRSGQKVRSLEGPFMLVNAAAFDPLDQIVATAGDDGALRLWRVVDGAELPWFQGHTAEVNLVRFSPDGQRLATASADKTVMLWDVQRGRLITRLIDRPAIVTALEFSQDGQWILTAGSDATARLWSATTGRLFHVLTGHTGWIRSAHFSPDSRRMATASNDGSIRLWDVATGMPIGTPLQQEDEVHALDFSPDGSLLATAGKNKIVKLWDVETGNLRLPQIQQTSIRFVKFSPDGATVVTGGADGTLCLWVWRTNQTRCWQGHAGQITALVFHPSGALLATSGTDSTARLWDVQRGVELRVFQHSSTVTRVMFTHDGRGLLTVSLDQSGRLWDVQSGAERLRFAGHSAGVQDAAIAPDDQSVATASNDFTVRLWRTQSNESERQLTGHQGAVTAVAFTPDGAQALTAGVDGKVRLWVVATKKLQIEFTRHISAVQAIAISPNGALVASGDDEGRVLLWRASDGALLHTLAEHTGTIRSIAFSPDGQMVATASKDAKVILWSTQDGQLLRGLTGHQAAVVSAAFRPDGKTLVTASTDQTARLWDIKSGRELISVTLSTGQLVAAALSPDGQVMALAHKDLLEQNFLTFWQIAQQRVWSPFAQHGHTSYVKALTFSADGRLLLTASADGTARLWDIATAQEIRRLQLADASLSFTSIAISPDGQTILEGASNGKAYLWPTIDGLLHQAETLIPRQPPIFWASERRQFKLDGLSIVENPLK